MTIKVEQGVPLPTRTHNTETRELTETLGTMDAGDSFLWELKGRKESSQRLRIHQRARAAGVKVMISTEGENLRVWKLPVKGRQH